MNNTYYIETYGCQMNVYDSELIANQLIKTGYSETKSIENADIIFLNTCSIREKAEETVHNRLINLEHLKKKKPDMLIGVVGCMAQNLKNDLLESKPYVDIILGPDSYRKIPEIISSRKNNISHVVDTKLSKFEVYNDMFPSRKNGINAWISIMRGCDKFCTFCIVPFTRGRERSRPVESIKKEVTDAVKNGFLEITLLGQNVNSYSTSEGDFSFLLEELANIKGLKRIRYTSPHPRDIDDKLLNIMRKYNIPYALLHCTNIYPTPPNLVRLDSMVELNHHFEDAVVGLSDHTTSNYACLGAVALGASILERHFTDSMDREGPDIVNSMDTIACKELIEGSKIMKQERGGSKGPVEEEIPTINFAPCLIK